MRFLLLLIALSLSGTAWAQENLPLGITVLQQALDVSSTHQPEITQGEMELLSPDLKVVNRRVFEMKRLETSDGKETKLLLTITTPADLAGTKLLSIQLADGSRETWIYLPSSHQTKKIAASDESGRFLGSEFTYGDFLKEDLKSKSVESMAAGLVKATSRIGPAIASLYWIDATTHQIQKIEYRDETGKLKRTAEFKDYQQITPHVWRPSLVIMTNQETWRQTKLITHDTKIGVKLSNADFSKTAMGR